MWASETRVALDETGLVHLYRVGDPHITLCNRWADTAIGFELPTCVACIAYWTRPCSVLCATFMGCEHCDDSRGAPR